MSTKINPPASGQKSKFKMTKFTFFILYFSLFFAIGGLQCKKPTQPDDGKPKKDFIWSVDTLFNPQGFKVIPMYISGSSSKDVWAVGFNEVHQGEIFRFDGNRWTNETPLLPFNHELTSVHVFAPNHVYVVGYKYWFDPELRLQSLILFYNGLTWRVEDVPIGNSLRHIYGRSKNDIWTCGMYGTLFHFNGIQWDKIQCDTIYHLGPIFQTPDGKTFLIKHTKYNPVTADTFMYYFSTIQNNILIDIDSCKTFNDRWGDRVGFKFGVQAMWGISENELYSAGNFIFKYNGSSWNYVFWDDYPFEDIKGTARNNIYAVGLHGTIGYYDGEKWNRIWKYSSTIVDFYSVMPFEDEVFILGYYRGNSYVVRGKVIYIKEE